MVESQQDTSSTTTAHPPARVITFTVRDTPRVKWTEDTKDNEGLGMKKSNGISTFR